MHTTDRQRILRSAGMAVAALLLVGGAVFGSQAALSGGPDSFADELHSQSLDASQEFEASESPDASPEQNEDEAEADDAGESPDASPEQNEAQDSEADDAGESPDASPDESDDVDDDASESPDASPDESDHSGPGGGDDHSDD